MSDFVKVKKLTSATGGTVNFPNGINIAGSDSGITGTKHTVSTTEPSTPSNGDTWFNPNGDYYYVRMDNDWKPWLGSPPSALYWAGDRGICPSGYDGSGTAHTDYPVTIDYFDITTTGNASDFGDLKYTYYAGNYYREKGWYYQAGVSNRTRGVWIGYEVSTADGGVRDDIEYITIATTGNAQDFGNLPWSRSRSCGCSDGTKGLVWGGRLAQRDRLYPGTYQPGSGPWTGPETGSRWDDIYYVTIDTTSDASAFGDLVSVRHLSGACSNGTYGVVGGGSIGDYTDLGYTFAQSKSHMEYVTIATLGNASTFGFLHYDNSTNDGASTSAACSNETIGLWFTYDLKIDRVVLSTTGNATDFGDISSGQKTGSACANETRATYSGGFTTGNAVTNISYVTIATPGNSQDFGDLTVGKESIHGGGLSGNAS